MASSNQLQFASAINKVHQGCLAFPSRAGVGAYTDARVLWGTAGGGAVVLEV